MPDKWERLRELIKNRITAIQWASSSGTINKNWLKNLLREYKEILAEMSRLEKEKNE